MTVVIEWADAAPLALTGRPQRLVPLVLGFEPISEAVAVRGGSAFKYLMVPVTAAAVEFDRGWVLWDGGFEPARIRDPRRRAASFDYQSYLPVVPPGDPLVDQIAEAGLEWDDLAAAVLSHAHFDHTGGIRMLRPHQPLLTQRREWTHVCTAPSERAAFLFREDFDHAGLTIGLVDGDAEIVPGLRVIDTAGHTPGHQSLVVELPDRTVVLAGDAADLRGNIEGRLLPGSIADPEDVVRAEDAINRLAEMDAAERSEVWPGHDPHWGPWRQVIDAR
jgi:N-acyl homoserine lactone hydrolase